MKTTAKYIMPQTEVQTMETSLFIMQEVSGGAIKGTKDPIIDPGFYPM